MPLLEHLLCRFLQQLNSAGLTVTKEFVFHFHGVSIQWGARFCQMHTGQTLAFEFGLRVLTMRIKVL